VSAPAPETPAPQAGACPARRAAGLVAAGILLSRLASFVRLRVFAHYFGEGDAADAFSAALALSLSFER
jgi:putative peptidoglycan lipid II flippase